MSLMLNVELIRYSKVNNADQNLEHLEQEMECWKIDGDYEIRSMTGETFQPLFKHWRPKLFSENITFWPDSIYSKEEQEKLKNLRKRGGDPYDLHLALFFKDEFIGWSTGKQIDFDRFYMANSAIFPEHRGKGLYYHLIKKVIDLASAEGFQVITSRHAASNSQVIVPKLKVGFVISGFEITDVFGLSVNLSYFVNPIRKKVMQIRVGEVKPDIKYKGYLGI